jgi:hypothetical protein
VNWLPKKQINKEGVSVPFPVTTVTEAALNDIVSTSGLNQEEIVEFFVRAVENMQAKGVKQNVERLAINSVRNEVRKLTKKQDFVPKAKAESIVRFVIGDSGLFDKINMIKNIAKSYSSKHGISAALERGYINEKNQILDTRKQIFGKDNPKYGEPLTEDVVDMSHTIHLLARINGDKVFKYGTMQSNDPKLCKAWNKLKFFTLAQTFGIVKENDKDQFKLNGSIAEETLSIFKAVKDEDVDFEKVFLEYTTPKMTKIVDIEREHELTKEAWDRIVFVRGMVAWIARDRPSPFGAINMGLMDDEGNLVRVSIPEQVPSDFGESSEIVVIAKTDRGDLREENDEGKVRYIKGKGDVYLRAVGIYPLKGLTTPANINKVESLEQESELEGWIS